MGRSVRTAALVAWMLVIAGCGLFAEEDERGAGDGRYPMTVSNCGSAIEIPARPERVVLLTGTDVGFLAQLGVLDRVVGRAGAYESEYHDAELNAAVAQIPEIEAELDATASLQVTTEAILAEDPDLVLDAVQTDRVTGLGRLGVPVLNDEAMCPAGLDEPSFDAVYDQMDLYGTVFDREAEASEANDELRARVERAREQVPTDESRTAAVLYPVVGGTPRAYGNRSMASAVIEEAGFTNVYDDLDERRAEIGIEDLIERDPDVLVLLHVDGTPEQARQALATLPGADQLTALRNDEVLTLLFNFAEPPTPSAVDGLERIVAHFGGHR